MFDNRMSLMEMIAYGIGAPDIADTVRYYR